MFETLQRADLEDIEALIVRGRLKDGSGLRADFKRRKQEGKDARGECWWVGQRGWRVVISMSLSVDAADYDLS